MKISTALTALALSLLFSAAARADDAGAKAPPTDQASLLDRLDNDYHNLLAVDDHPEPIREAATLLEQTNQNNRWTNYAKAVEILRQHRSKAAVPLLMRYMVEHAAFGSSHVIIPAYVDTIRILTGEKIDYPEYQGRDRTGLMVDAVISMYTGWWQPNKDKLTVDLGKMGDEQLKNVATELLRQSEKELATHPGGGNRQLSAQQEYERLATSMGETSMRRQWYANELHARMTPIFLADAGYVEKPADDPASGSGHVDFPAIPLLAALCKNGDAPKLDDIAKDPKQNAATRLTCILALHAAGKDVRSQPLLAIYDADKRADVRVLSLLMLAIGDKNDAAGPKLLTALDDDDKEIRVAALTSLRTIAPKAALPKLAKVLKDGQPDDLIDPGLRLLSGIGGDDVAAMLADYLQKVIDDGADRNKLLRALDAFSTVTGQRWMDAGAHPPAYYEQQARKAVEWWRSKHPVADT
jgi:hypothetical protein